MEAQKWSQSVFTGIWWFLSLIDRSNIANWSPNFSCCSHTTYQLFWSTQFFSFIHLIFFEPASSKTGRYTLDFLASDQADMGHITDTHLVYVITYRICKGTRAHTALPQSAVTSSAFPEATSRLKALCHFHHERVSCKTTNFSLFNFCSFRQMHLFFRAWHEYFRAEWHIQWRMKRERQWGGEVQGGMGNQIWFLQIS